MASITTQPNCITECFNRIQHQVYSIYESTWESCDTDTKIYAFLILGRVLQVAAYWSIGASIVNVFLTAPIAIVVALPVCLLGVLVVNLGDYFVQNKEILSQTPLIDPPFVPGQPIGLINSGNNCWLNASLQLLANVSFFERYLKNIPDFAQFLNAYSQDGAEFNKVSSRINPLMIRQMLHRETGGQIDAGHRQEDAAQVFEYLFQGDRSLYSFEQLLNGAPSSPRQEPMIQLSMQRDESNPNFLELLNDCFDHWTDRAQRQQLFFSSAPENLLIQFKRFYRDPDGTQGKIVHNVETPSNFQFPNRLVRSFESAIYSCNGFIVHYGATNAGHYVAYIKKDQKWWRISDRNVSVVSESVAQNACKQSYIINYTKI